MNDVLLKENVLNFCFIFGTLRSLNFNETFTINSRNKLPGFMNASGDIDFSKGLSGMQIFHETVKI